MHSNDWEQLCINYANEKLELISVQETVMHERHEYQSEGFPYNIVCPDNSSHIALLEQRGGLLNVLKEECRLPSGSKRAHVVIVTLVVIVRR